MQQLASFSICKMGLVMPPSHETHLEELLPLLQSLFVYCSQVLLGLQTLNIPASQQSSGCWERFPPALPTSPLHLISLVPRCLDIATDVTVVPAASFTTHSLQNSSRIYPWLALREPPQSKHRSQLKLTLFTQSCWYLFPDSLRAFTG